MPIDAPPKPSVPSSSLVGLVLLATIMTQNHPHWYSYCLKWTQKM
jgi:hypothetical protein